MALELRTALNGRSPLSQRGQKMMDQDLRPPIITNINPSTTEPPRMHQSTVSDIPSVQFNTPPGLDFAKMSTFIAIPASNKITPSIFILNSFGSQLR